MDASIGWVDAELTASDTSLPRIPPLRGRLRLEIPYQQLRIEPEVIVAAAQNNVFLMLLLLWLLLLLLLLVVSMISKQRRRRVD